MSAWIDTLSALEKVRRTRVKRFMERIPTFVSRLSGTLQLEINAYHKEFPSEVFLETDNDRGRITIRAISDYNPPAVAEVSISAIFGKISCLYSYTYQESWTETLHSADDSLVWATQDAPGKPPSVLARRILQPVLFPGLGEDPLQTRST